MGGKNKFQVKYLEPGTVFETPLFTGDGLKLADEFTVLTAERLDKLKKWGVKAVTSSGSPLTENQQQELKKAAEESKKKLRPAESRIPLEEKVDHSAVEEAVFYDPLDKKQVKKSYDRALEKTRDLFEKFNREGINELTEIKSALSPVFNSVWNYQLLLLYLISDQEHAEEGYIYRYSLNTAILSMIIADQLDYSRAENRLLGMGALLHDAGMLKLPERLRKQEGKYSEREKQTMQKHVNKALQGLAGGPKFEVIRSIITQHHESYDGRGYPRGLEGEEINPYARIVNLVMTYVAMTQPRFHRRQYGVQHSIREVIYREKQKFDPVVLKGFVRIMGVYPPGSLIKISSGHHALVMESAPERPLSPIVRVLTDVEGNKLEEPYRLHLSRENITVDKTLVKSDYKFRAFEVV